MSQHDMDLANAAGASFRSDANLAIVALVSNNSGATAPATMFANMWWSDTTLGIDWQRNSANAAWEFRAYMSRAITATTRSATTTFITTLDHTLSDTTTTITAFNGVAGVTYHCRALGAGTITHHATNLIITQGGASIASAADDTFDVEMLTATTCRIKNYQRAQLNAALAGSASQAFATAALTISGLQTLAAGANIASAATVDLTAATGNSPRITGTAATSAVTMTAGQQMRVVADGAWPLTYHATNLKLQGGVSHTCVAGDIVDFYKDLSGVVHGIVHRTGAARVKVIQFTRDLSLASGDVAYTGVGGTPIKSIRFHAAMGAAYGNSVGEGFDGVTNNCCNYQYTDGFFYTANDRCINISTTTTNLQKAFVKSRESDGFTLTWEKVGTPTGTVTITAFVEY